MAASDPDNGYLAGGGDDQLWITELNAIQLRALLENASTWVGLLGARLGHDLALQDNSVITVKLSDARPRDPSVQKAFIAQGIVGTNHIMVSPTLGRSDITPTAEDLAYWNEWAASVENGGPRIEAAIFKNAGQGYSHVEISKDGDSPATRAKKVAAFILLATDDTQAWTDPATQVKYFYLHRIFKRPVTKLTVDGADKPVRPVVRVEPYSATSNAIKKIQFTVALNNGGGLVMDDDSPTACENMAGTVPNDGGDPMIDPDDVVIKNYA